MFLPCAQWQDLVEWLVVFRGSLEPKGKQRESHRDALCMKSNAYQCAYKAVRVDPNVIAVSAPILNLANLCPCVQDLHRYIVWSLHLDFQLLDDVPSRVYLVTAKRLV